MENITKIHGTYHRFQNWLIKNYGSDLYSEWKKQKVKQPNGRYKTFKYRQYNEWELSKRLSGYEVISKIEKYIKRNSREIKIVHCDDTYYAGSIILLIPHPTHGITVMFIPQLTSIQNEFFLYGNHYEELLEKLKELKETYVDEEL